MVCEVYVKVWWWKESVTEEKAESTHSCGVTANGRRVWKRDEPPPGVSEIAKRRRLYSAERRLKGTGIKSVVSKR